MCSCEPLRLPNLLHHLCAGFWQLFGHKVSTASDDKQRLGAGRSFVCSDLVQNFFQVSSGDSSRATDILIESFQGVLKALGWN